jgi:hypothetical protein
MDLEVCRFRACRRFVSTRQLQLLLIVMVTSQLAHHTMPYAKPTPALRKATRCHKPEDRDLQKASCA